jgi:hypothetical protein
VNQRAVVGVDCEIDRAILSRVVVDERLLAIAEFGLAPPKQDVLAIVTPLQHGIVQRGQHPVDREFRRVDIEPSHLNRFVGCDDNFLVELGDSTELGMARNRVAVAGECHVALAELRHRLGWLRGPKLPAIAVDLALAAGVEIDQRAVVVGPFLGILLPEFAILGVNRSPLGLDSVIESLKVRLFLVGHRLSDLAGL